ncbi:MAG: manganese efflux pump MntP family protein, partial [Bacteroides sp.]|nr:manganese efflux pump MntP family protein [Bacteroides sp.]
MNDLEIWLLAIGLAMDCLTVAIASGILLKKIEWKPMLAIACSFGFFQGLMPLIGWTGAHHFSYLIESVDHWIAFGILGFLGVRMILESFKEEECKQELNPTNYKVILALSIATSIDALAIGVTFAFLDMNSLSAITSPVLIIGFVSFLLSLCGLFFGICCGNRWNLRVELWGGLILIIIGSKILLEHL